MSEFIVKVPQEWHNSNEALPEIGRDVEVLCTIITKASLVGTTPKPLWQQSEELKDVHVQLWRYIDKKENENDNTGGLPKV